MGVRNFHLKRRGSVLALSWSWLSRGATFELDNPVMPLKFAGNGGRVPNAAHPAKTASNRFFARDFAKRLPQTTVPITELYVHFPSFYAPTSGEIDADGYTIEGAAVRDIVTGARTRILVNDGLDPVVVPPGSPTTSGRWVKLSAPEGVDPATLFVPGKVTLFSWAGFCAEGAVLPNTTWRPISNRALLHPNHPGMDYSLAARNNESSQGSSSSMLSTLSGSANYTNVAAGVPSPSHMLCRMAVSEPSVVMVGDSILADDSSFIEFGLDDATFGLRVASGSFAVAGWGYLDAGTNNGHANPAAAARQLKIVEQARALNGGRPVCDHFISNHGTNSSTAPIADQRRSFRALHSLWKNALGCTQSSHTEMLPFPQSSDGYRTLVNQTVTAANDYPSGQRWLINEDIGGPDGLGSPAAAFRADGTIIDSFAPWRISAADLTTQRDRLSVRPFTTTLAAAYAGDFAPLSLVHRPTLGDMIAVNNGATFGTVVAVSGTGPFLTTMVFNFGGGVSAPSGAHVQSCWHDSTGLHPSALAHYAMAFNAADSTRAWRERRGWVPANSAPAIAASAISGTPENGQTLTANATVTGFPVPTLAYQWQRNGANISGQTAQTITLNEGGMSLANGDTISCEITATNSQGTATAEPSATYSGALEVAAFLALISGSSASGFFDFTDATTASGFTGPNANGGTAFVARAGFQAPGISPTLGALFNATNRVIDRVVTAGAYDIVFGFARDSGNNAARMLNSTSQGIYDSGSTTAASPTTRVNGTAVATRQAFHAALTAGVERTIEFENYTPPATTLSFGDDSFTPRGSIRRVAVIRRADFPSNLAAVRTAAIAAVQAS